MSNAKGNNSKPTANKASNNNNNNNSSNNSSHRRNFQQDGKKQRAWTHTDGGAITTTANNNNSNSNNSNVKPTNENNEAISKHMHDRLNYLFIKSIGSSAIVTVSSGDRYKGIFSAAMSDGELGVVLTYATKYSSGPGEDDNNNNSKQEKFKKLVIQSKDLVDVLIESPEMTPDKAEETAITNKLNNGKAQFKTDADISANKNTSYERELERWTPDELTEHALHTSLEDAHDGKEWDQFAANRDKFGVESTYDEHYYTTAINKNLPNYKEIEKRAEKIAQEISNSSYGGNVHLAEERGILVDDSGLDEEDKYSGVDRRPIPNVVIPPSSTTGNKYAPPAFRAPTGKKTTGGVPYDPAIISSAMATPDGRLTARSVDKNEEENSSRSTPDIQTKLPPTSNSKTPSTNNDNNNNTGIEKELAGNFRQFVSVEVERLHQKKQYLQKKEKTDRLHDFKKFSEGYKISAPVPPDLIPILAKDKEKQEEILQKAKASQSKSPNLSSSQVASPIQRSDASPVTTDSSPRPQPRQQQQQQQQQGTPTLSSARPKFNFKVPEFKPNPSAHAFTPSVSSNGVASPAASATSLSPRHNTSTSTPILQQPQQQQPPVSINTAASPQIRNKPPIAITPALFFGPNKVLKPKSRSGKFNPFITAKQEYDKDTSESKGPIIIERAYATGPTWNSTIDKTYAEAYPLPKLPYFDNAIMSPKAAANVMFSGNMMSLMQPGFDGTGMMMAGSPPPMPAQMMPGLMPYNAGAYGQFNAPPQYYGRGAPPQPFMNSQMMNQAAAAAVAFPMGYMRQQYNSPRSPQTGMTPNPQAAAAASGGYFQPYQQQFQNRPQGGRYHNNHNKASQEQQQDER